MAFRSCLDDCMLKDFGYEGIPYTWCNKRKSKDSINEHLGRAIANWTWCNLWPRVKVIHDNAAHLDHIPLILHLKGVEQNKRGPKLFCFEAMWVGNEGCK